MMPGGKKQKRAGRLKWGRSGERAVCGRDKVQVESKSDNGDDADDADGDYVATMS